MCAEGQKTKEEVEVSQRKAEMGDLVTRVGVGEGGAERHGSWSRPWRPRHMVSPWVPLIITVTIPRVLLKQKP